MPGRGNKSRSGRKKIHNQAQVRHTGTTNNEDSLTQMALIKPWCQRSRQKRALMKGIQIN